MQITVEIRSGVNCSKSLVLVPKQRKLDNLDESWQETRGPELKSVKIIYSLQKEEVLALREMTKNAT